METLTKRYIKNGFEYDHLFPEMEGQEKLVKKGATVEDTVEFIPEAVKMSKHQVETLVKVLKGKTLIDTLKNIWQFLVDHIEYVKDEEGKEQIKSAVRTWKDRKGDCDDYSTFISSCLSTKTLSIPHKLRIASYWYSPDKFTHIYIVVPHNGKEIIVDCVVNKFNYEEPRIRIKDKDMDLYYLNGIERPTSIDFADLSQDGLSDLGKIQIFNKVGKVLKKGLNVVNKVNPATVLLRAGVLASMKLNVFNVAEKLRFAYLSDAEAKKRGFNAAKFAKLKTVKDKIEKIFYGAGGKPENLKEAILTGKGNASKEVSGFTGNESILPLSEVIGNRLYADEIPALNGLGEPATGAALAAASAIMASIAAIIKSIGNLKDAGAAPAATDAAITNLDTAIPVPAGTDNYSEEEYYEEPSEGPTPMKRSLPSPPSESDSTVPETTETTTPTTKTDTTTPTEQKWYQAKWVKPTAIVGGSLLALYVGYKIYKNSQSGKPAKKETALSGFQNKHKRRRNNKKNKPKAVRWA